MALNGKTSLRVNYKLEEKIFGVTMAGKRSLRKAILYTYPSSFRTNEVALRNRLLFFFDEFNKCVACLRDKLRPINTLEFSPNRVNFKALTLPTSHPSVQPIPVANRRQHRH